jgi:ABC-type multidrug transport system ATPase subunit
MPTLVKAGLTDAEYLREIEQGRGGKSDVKVSFSNLSVHVTLPNGDKKSILDGVSGSAHTGQVMAVMGPTGCGK